MTVNAAQSFNFFPVPTDIHFGCGSIRSLPERLRAVGGTKAFLITDPGVRAAGILDEVTRPLDGAGPNSNGPNAMRSSASGAGARSTRPKRWRHWPPTPDRRFPMPGFTRVVTARCP